MPGQRKTNSRVNKNLANQTAKEFYKLGQSSPDITKENELKIIQILRNYYRDNFQNGQSTESFLTWIENKLVELGEIKLS